MSNPSAAILPFSKHALTYRQYDGVQRRIAAQLMQKISVQSPAMIVDLGCGCGDDLANLMQAYPVAHGLGIDIASPMIQLAKAHKIARTTWINADMGAVFAPQKVDLLYSNASLQWVTDLDQVFSHWRPQMTEGGQVYFSTLGPQTLSDLSNALSEVLNRPIRLTAAQFLSPQTVERIFKAYWPNGRLKVAWEVQRYDSVLAFMREIQKTGTVGFGVPNTPWTPRLVTELETVFMKRFGQIQANYQVIYGQSGEL